eukprot:754420-Hanusia_phi.AAC.2
MAGPTDRAACCQAERMETGGLGKLLVQDVVKVWACFKNEACLQELSANNSDWICYVYEEQAKWDKRTRRQWKKSQQVSAIWSS